MLRALPMTGIIAQLPQALGALWLEEPRQDLGACNQFTVKSHFSNGFSENFNLFSYEMNLASDFSPRAKPLEKAPEAGGRRED